MAAYSISNCPSEKSIVFIGNVRLRSFVETDPRFLSDPATMELVLDVIVEERFLNTNFQNMRLFVRIISPTEAHFVEHSARNNYERDLLSESGDSLRIRESEVNLLSGYLNGKTYYIGIGGISSDDQLQFNAFVETDYLRSSTASCVATVSDLSIGESIGGYLN